MLAAACCVLCAARLEWTAQVRPFNKREAGMSCVIKMEGRLSLAPVVAALLLSHRWHLGVGICRHICFPSRAVRPMRVPPQHCAAASTWARPSFARCRSVQVLRGAVATNNERMCVRAYLCCFTRPRTAFPPPSFTTTHHCSIFVHPSSPLISR